MRSLFSNVAGNVTLQEKAKLLQKVYFNELNKDCTKSFSTYFFVENVQVVVPIKRKRISSD